MLGFAGGRDDGRLVLGERCVAGSMFNKSSLTLVYLSDRPRRRTSGQVAHYHYAVYVGQTVSSPSTAALPAAELAGFDICASPDNDATPTLLLAPLFRPVSPADSGPGFSEPCVARRGRVEARDDLFLHFCLECGAWGAFGYGVNLRADQLGRWYCAAHRRQGSFYAQSSVK